MVGTLYTYIIINDIDLRITVLCKEEKNAALVACLYLHVCDYRVSVCKLPASDFRVVEIIIKITRYLPYG